MTIIQFKFQGVDGEQGMQGLEGRRGKRGPVVHIVMMGGNNNN